MGDIGALTAVEPTGEGWYRATVHPDWKIWEWLLLHAHSPVAQGGLLSWTGRVWSEGRKLLAGGGGQAVFRPNLRDGAAGRTAPHSTV